MSNPQTDSFNFIKIAFPRLSVLSLKPLTEDQLNHGFRLQIIVTNDKALSVVFGIEIRSNEQVNNRPALQCQVDGMANFETNFVISNDPKIKNLPMLGNMLAAMFPFLREKAHYLLAANDLPAILPPLNVFQLLQENAENEAFKLTDMRKEATTVNQEATS